MDVDGALFRVSESRLAGVDGLLVSESRLAGVDGLLVSEAWLAGVDGLLFYVAILQSLQTQVVLALLGYSL